MKIGNTVLPEKAAFGLRLGVGVGFGLVMACLLGHRYTVTNNIAAWRAVVYTTLSLTAFIWWAGAGTLRRGSLAAWGVITTAAIAALAWHQTAQGGVQAYVFLTPAGCLVLPLLFIAHELVSSADRAGRIIAPYATYFDQAWKHGVQLGLSLLFTGLFWAILWLGAALLGLIGFDWLGKLLIKDWFALPVSGAAMACAVQLGDVQDKLLINVRALVLNVLSWLLPVIALIGLLFLASLCVSGLAPLWKTKAATTTLLSASIVFVLLINAAYQQGDRERPVNIVMKWAARLSCFLLLAFAALAADSLWLRVDQYGLSPERVLAGAGVIIACLFGLGYAAAAVWPGRWLARMQGVNIVMACVKVAIFLGLLTPLADPARLSVADQVARLQSGRTQSARFDWGLLDYQTGLYGKTALKTLVTNGQSADIRTRAAAVLKGDEEVATRATAVAKPAGDIGRVKVVYPAGKALPPSFTAQVLEGAGMTDCLGDGDATCTAALIDLNGDGADEVVIRDDNNLFVFTRTDGRWTIVAEPQSLDTAAAKAFDAGQISTQPHTWSDLNIGRTTVTVEGTR